MKRNLCFLTIGMLALGLLGCGSKQDTGADTVTGVQESSIESTTGEASEEVSDLQDAEGTTEEGNDQKVPLEQDAAQWQEAYKALMAELNEGNFGDDLTFFGYQPDDQEYKDLLANGYGVDGYYLYDVDKDGIPELIVKFGTCEADYDGRMYSFDGENAVYIDEFFMGHLSVATCPSQNGVILSYGHMGSAYMQKVSLVNGTLEYEELLEENLEDDPDADYTLPGEVIPGAEYLTLMKPQDILPIDTYTTWIDNMSADVDATTVPDEDLEQIYLDTIYANGTVVGITADGYGGDTGEASLEEYLGPNMVSTYSDSGMKIVAYTFVDMNQDGKEECVLRLTDQDQTQGDEYSGQWVVLSEQNGTVYAYCINYMMTYTLLENGSFRPGDEYSTNNFRILFDQDQCFLYYTGMDEKHAEQEWVTY